LVSSLIGLSVLILRGKSEGVMQARFLQANTSESNQTQESFMMVVGTDLGQLYTFSPRSIQSTFKYLTTVQHSSVLMGLASQQTPELQIRDIRIDEGDRLIFVSVGNEVYAQPYYIQLTAMSNQVTQPLGANISYTERFVAVSPATPSPLLVYTASGQVTSMAIDARSNFLYVADEAISQIVRLDYSGFLQNR